MKTYTATALRADLYRVLDEVLATGVPIEIERNGQRLRIAPAVRRDRLKYLRPHPGAIIGDPEDLVHIDWSGEWKPDFP